jgi:hypothetical protein
MYSLSWRQERTHQFMPGPFGIFGAFKWMISRLVSLLACGSSKQQQVPVRILDDEEHGGKSTGR